jgi:hypothetical protein
MAATGRLTAVRLCRRGYSKRGLLNKKNREPRKEFFPTTGYCLSNFFIAYIRAQKVLRSAVTSSVICSNRSIEVVIRAHPLIAVPIAVIIVTAVSVRDSNRTEQEWPEETIVPDVEPIDPIETSCTERSEAT